MSLTAGQASLRVHVWRKLRSLGSVYLQSSVCLLPDRPDTMRAVRRLLDRVHGDGGSGRLLRINLPDEDEAQDIREEFNSARDGEYAEVLERLPTLAQEITMERGRGRATYAEVEESEADLARFHTWLGKIARRDYFAAPGGEAARAAVAAVGEQLAAFEEEALNAEAPPGRPLRAVPHQRTRRTADG
ncbi:Chromate resistance protein ChrB [Nakamurella sp. A5-74]|uniref:Chromate resistance protein ChrB n=1 Tax=Nakamurella sp. A5-74 TaxID=3158264 RepID=A0AAU8DJC7_9ACTN